MRQKIRYVVVVSVDQNERDSRDTGRFGKRIDQTIVPVGTGLPPQVANMKNQAAPSGCRGAGGRLYDARVAVSITQNTDRESHATHSTGQPFNLPESSKSRFSKQIGDT